MKFSCLSARGGIGAAALAITTLAALHILKPDISPSRNMISQYALGRHGWVMGGSPCSTHFCTAVLEHRDRMERRQRPSISDQP